VLTLIALILIVLTLNVLALVAAAMFPLPLLGPSVRLSLAGSGLRLGRSIIAARHDALLRIRGDRQGDQDRNEAGISHSSTHVVRLASLNDVSILHQKGVGCRGARVQRCNGAKCTPHPVGTPHPRTPHPAPVHPCTPAPLHPDLGV